MSKARSNQLKKQASSPKNRVLWFLKLLLILAFPIDYLPDHPTLANYQYLIQNVGLIPKIVNTLIIVGSTILISTILCVLAAYAFARFSSSKGISLVFGFIIATMLIPDIVLARPLYTFWQSVKLYDTYPGIIILYISAVIPFTIMILRNFVGEIPVALEEAAAIEPPEEFSDAHALLQEASTDMEQAADDFASAFSSDPPDEDLLKTAASEYQKAQDTLQSAITALRAVGSSA